jgi:hypothetical protein
LSPVTESKPLFGEKLALIAIVMVLFEKLSRGAVALGCEQGRVGSWA